MKVLVTGSDGNVGNQIVKNLLKCKKYQLFLFSNKRKKNIINKVFYKDLLKPINLKLNIDSIIHCAGKTHNSIIGNSMKSVYRTNIKIIENIVNFANKNKVKSIFFLSSIDVYGNKKNNIISENLKPSKINLYAKSKLSSENILCKKGNKFRAICLRLPGIVNHNLKKNYPLMNFLLKKIKNNKKVLLYNSNNKFNSIIDAIEISNFIHHVLTKKKLKFKSGIYNFSASNPINFFTLVNLIKKKFKSKSQIIKYYSNTSSCIISNKKLFNNFKFNTASSKTIIERCCDEILKKNKNLK